MFLKAMCPIELSRLIYYFLKSDSSANVFSKVKREIGLVVPALYMATADMSENGKRVIKILADEIRKINECYPHFDVVITGDYMSRPVVNKIVKDIVIYIFFLFWAEVEGICYYKRQPKKGVLY